MNIKGEKLDLVLKNMRFSKEKLIKYVERLIWYTDNYDRAIYSFDEYYGVEFMGKTIGEWIDKSDKDFIKDELYQDFMFPIEKLFNSLMSLTMVGDGDCEKCGCDEHNETERDGEETGDGYQQPLGFSGVITVSCINCETERKISLIY